MDNIELNDGFAIIDGAAVYNIVKTDRLGGGSGRVNYEALMDVCATACRSKDGVIEITQNANNSDAQSMFIDKLKLSGYGTVNTVPHDRMQLLNPNSARVVHLTELMAHTIGGYDGYNLIVVTNDIRLYPVLTRHIENSGGNAVVIVAFPRSKMPAAWMATGIYGTVNADGKLQTGNLRFLDLDPYMGQVFNIDPKMCFMPKAIAPMRPAQVTKTPVQASKPVYTGPNQIARFNPIKRQSPKQVAALVNSNIPDDRLDARLNGNVPLVETAVSDAELDAVNGNK